MIKPTIGRVVWYHPPSDNSPDARPRIGTQPHAALIAGVWNDSCINLAAFDANGKAYNVTSVLLWQDVNSPRPLDGYAEWMPYQISQAKKHDEPKASDGLDAAAAKAIARHFPPLI